MKRTMKNSVTNSKSTDSQAAKNFIDELVDNGNDYINSAYEYGVSDWKELASKSVEDSDGFNTDYTLYTNGETYICMFGDKDIYEPDASYADYETESEQDAWDWFNSYTGFADEEYDDDLVFVDNRKSSIVNNDPSLDPGFDEYDVYGSGVKASIGTYYFGKDAADKYGNLIVDHLKGKSVSKRRSTANEPGGLIYEANKLGIDMWDLLEALEGMCADGRAEEIDDSTYKILGASDVYSSEDFDEYEDDIQEIGQEFTSENTSINSNKLPAIFRMVSFEPGTTNIDYGGGRFDNVAEYLTQYDVINLVYDPYNRTPEHNKEVIKTLRRAGGADTATCSNVLNVIKEPEVRRNVLENISKIVKPGRKIYITVYEGSGKGDEGPTKAGYQLNRRTADYLDEIREVFPDAKRRGKLITAHNTRSVNSSVNASDEGYVYTYCDECGKKNRVKVTFNNFNEPFNDTEYKCKYCGTRNMLTDPHEYDDEGYVVESSQSYIKNSENDHDFYFEPDKNSIINAIMFGMSLSREVATIIYNWYDAEDAFDDFDSEVDMVEFIKSDIYDMLDACTNTKEKDLVYRALRQANDMTDVDDPITSSTKSQSYLDRIDELMEQGLDEETASREAYAEFYPDEYDSDDYDECY